MTPARSARSRRRRRNSLLSTALVLALLLALAVFAFVKAASLHGQAARSQRVQAAGVRAEVTIVGHEYERHFARYSTSYDTLLRARFEHPRDGRSRTTVHVRGRTIDVRPGTTRIVVIDAGDPRYSEADGKPYRVDSDWFSRLAAGIVALLLAALVAWRTRKGPKPRRTSTRRRTPPVSLSKAPGNGAL